MARNGGPCVHAEIAACQCVAIVGPHQFVHGNRSLLYFLVVGEVDGLSESLVRRSYSMNSRKTLAHAEFPLKRDVATDCGSQGPMSQQNTDGSGRNELHAQKMVQLVGFRDPNAREHEGAASAAAVLASAA